MLLGLLLLPSLSRAHHRADDSMYAESFGRAFSLGMFVVVPAALAYAALSGPLAGAVAFGEMATPEGCGLIQYALPGVSLELIGEAALVLSAQAWYARRDGRLPLAAVALCTALAITGMLTSLALLDGMTLLLGIA